MIKKILLFSVIIHTTTINTSGQFNSKELQIFADINFLHDHDSKCLVKIHPTGKIVTPNNMDDDGNIILQESRNSASIQIPKQKNNIISITVNFKSNCFITNYEIPYEQLTNFGNIINFYENQSTISQINDKNDKATKILIGKVKTKNLCDQKTYSNKKHINTRPNSINTPPNNKRMTPKDILHSYQNLSDKDLPSIVKKLKKEGYSQKTLTEYDLQLIGKLSTYQIKFIIDHLPYESINKVH